MPAGPRPLAERTGVDVRSRGEVANELSELRRHLTDVPPHHGGGTRAALAERIARLEAELAALERPRPPGRPEQDGRAVPARPADPGATP